MSQATVRIPTPLRTLTGGNDEVKAEGATVGELIDHLDKSYPGMRERLLDDKGVRRFVNIYVGEEDIRFLDGLKTAIKGGEQVSIVPAIAGGAR
ncbi:MAG TPA: MoaD/ThiS family protein [Byssovorax sp.]|jgi:molybdopterin converting factor small subunit